MPAANPAPSGGSSVRAIAAAVAGTVFEWFDFFLYGSLAVVFGRLFFPPGHETAGLLAALAVFGAGWVVRHSARWCSAALATASAAAAPS